MNRDPMSESTTPVYKEYQDNSDSQSLDTNQLGNIPLFCSGCGAVYQEGRWIWSDKPADSCSMLCPACQRIHDRTPAGVLTVRGECFTDHRNDVMTLIHEVLDRVGTQHPLKRIIDMTGDDTEAVFTFTDEQLTREIGDSLQLTFDGVLEYQYSTEESMLRVFWQR